MHEGAVVERVEEGSRDVAHAFGNNPGKGRGDGVQEGFQGHKARKSHEDEAGGFPIAMLLEFAKTHDGAHNGAQPHEGEQGPTPIAHLTQGNERDGAVGTRNVPIDGGMVPLAQHFLGSPPFGQGVIDGGGDIRREHAKEVEPHAKLRPAVALLIYPIEERRAHNHAEQYARTMRRGVQYFFFL